MKYCALRDLLKCAPTDICGAKGKPTQDEDKPKNVAWAIRLLARYPVIGNAEWAGLLSAVMAESRGLELSLGLDEQLLLCDTLASALLANTFFRIDLRSPVYLSVRRVTFILYERSNAVIVTVE